MSVHALRSSPSDATDTRTGRGPRSWRIVLGIVAGLVLLLGLAMATLGAWLVALGGTPYYLLAGVAIVLAAALALLDRHATGMRIFAWTVLATLAWSLWEIHGKGWMHAWGFDLAGRIGLLFGLLAAMWIALRYARPPAGTRRAPGGAAPALALAVVAPALVLGSATAAMMLAQRDPGPAPHDERAPASPDADTSPGAASDPAQPEAADAPERAATGAAIGRSALQRSAEEWTAYGGSNLGENFSQATQITPQNVGRLEKAWEFNTADMPPNERVFYSFQNTPLKVDGSLFVCSNSNQVFALDPATGARQWHFDPQVPPEAMEPLFSVACRAVAYHEAADAGQDEDCARRVLLATTDSRLIALDARTGTPCAGFGADGTVDLAEGMGNQAIGLSSTTSGPVVVGARVIVGQQVSDNQRRDAPSGVVRAYDVRSGEFAWAWDARRIATPQQPLAPGEVWPRGTPNVWSVISADETLGLVYLPTGNSANDHYGGDRSPEEDEYTSAVVAVDVATGRTRWHFRTVDHDLWDYDVGAQPIVTDVEIDGAPRRVVLQATKQGSVYVLDAATGEPLLPVERRPVPQGALPGDRTSPTQPQSVALPNFAAAPGRDPERLDESHAFGLTPVDALYCRIQFRRMRYEGIYTPPTDHSGGMLLFPGTTGGLNWGGPAVDPERQILVTNNTRLANHVVLVPRDRVADLPIGDGGARPDQEVAPQAGSPYGAIRPIWRSPLGVPCNSPPWGYLAATDLRTGQLLWHQPLGTGFDSGPLGIPTRLKIRIGTPTAGGPIATRSGVTFIAAAQDNYLRAFETRSGRLLWEARLPAGAQATPMTYVHDGRQYVAIAAGGHARMETDLGDSLVVFALPQ